MNDGFLSQEEIDSLLQKNQEINGDQVVSEEEKDLIGEVGNISMATAATTLSTILGKKVTITTPKVETTNLQALQDNLSIPNVVLQVKFEQGLNGTNILLINISDASIIANLMMGGDGEQVSTELSDIEISAVSEAMNQMIGSASTSMSTMLKKDINIYPPSIQVWDSYEEIVVDDIEPQQPIVKIAFRMVVEGLIDSEIMQVLTLDTVEDIVNTMTGTTQSQPVEKEEVPEENILTEPVVHLQKETTSSRPEPVPVQMPQFDTLENRPVKGPPRNIDLIMDVPLEFSVVLGKAQKTVKDVLALSPGSVVELNKLAEEPLEIYVNGKLIAQGEVVVINENFGIRITNIISASERVKRLK